MSHQRKWIVTGSSSGIGCHIAKMLLNLDKAVIGLSRRPGPIESPCFLHIPVDFSRLDAVESLGKIDGDLEGVVFCHGFGEFKSLEQWSHPSIDAMLQVNLISHIHLARKLIANLKNQDRSYMIFIGSEAALEGKNRSSIYSAAKFGLRGFTQALRKESTSSGLKITMIQPGLTRTPFFDNLYFEPKKEERCAIDPADIAAAVALILASHEGTSFDEMIINPKASAVTFKN